MVSAVDTQMQTISRSTMDEVIDTHKYLLLPRLSSQLFFNQLCPQSSDPRNKRHVLALLVSYLLLSKLCCICFYQSSSELCLLSQLSNAASSELVIYCRTFIQKS